MPLSIFALMLMGTFDMVSVYVRETLMQLWTPDDVRGRVNAVNRVFIGASNELGEFRAGVVAARLGAVTAVVMGGAGTMAVAAIGPGPSRACAPPASWRSALRRLSDQQAGGAVGAGTNGRRHFYIRIDLDQKKLSSPD